jgi:hypothetical protein
MDAATCPFEKAILSARCNCELSTRRVVAERMNAGCRDSQAARRCRELLGLLHERARFALKSAGPVETLPFGKKMKVMVGGLSGLQAVMDPGAPPEPVGNVHRLVTAAAERYGGLERLPYAEIVKSIQATAGRRPRG